MGTDYFLNASDEDNIIRLYRLSATAKPVKEFDLNSFLKPENSRKNGKTKECDIEAVARVENRLYWIGSHGPDKKGNSEPSRHRFFATDLDGQSESTQIVPVGRPFTTLLEYLKTGTSEMAVALKKAEPLKHQSGGIDIEGMAATADGSLLIGFRSPLVNGKALVVRVANPAQIVELGAKPEIADSILLDLEQSGIRDMIATSRQDEYLILAGPPGVEGSFHLYRWKLGGTPELTGTALPTVAGAPEGLMLTSAASKLYISTDSGEQGNPACKDQQSMEKRKFQLLVLSADAQ